MGRISSSVGLVTGTAIDDTVNQLIKLSAIPRDRLSARVTQLQNERTAFTDLTVLSVGLQLAARGFGTSGIYNRTNVTSANAEAVSAVRDNDANPAVGDYKVRTLRTASTHTFRSAPVASSTRALGTAGTLTVRGGGYVDRSASLDELNGGRGVESGSIRITDRAGNSAIIDLSTATTIQDAINLINEAGEVNVEAVADGDRLKLVDQTGATDSNLIVEEVGGGTTAADLGLAGINVAADSATGADILRLSDTTLLSNLRDNRGLGFAAGDDLAITLKDGSTLNVDFADFSREASQAVGITDAANSDAKVTIQAVDTGAAADGIRIRFLNDDSIVAGEESVELIETDAGRELVFSINEGTTTAADIEAALAADPLLSLKYTATAGGDGSGTVSSADTATLSGGAAVEASENPTLGDLLRVLNAQDPTKLRAEISPGGDSIRIIDLTSGAGSFQVSDVGGGTFAADLGIAGTAGDDTLTGSRLLSGLSSVSLSTLNGGRGLGSLTAIDITTADGATAEIDLSSVSSLQDVINRINESGLSVDASIDPSGAGLRVRDLSGGAAENFTITSDDDTASSLGIEASTTDVIIDGSGLNAQFVSRSTKLTDLNQGKGIDNETFRITDSAGETDFIDISKDEISNVGELIDAINDLGLGVEASINETGDGIRLIDTAGGDSKLKIEDLGNGTTAADLGIAGTAYNEVVGGELVSTLQGRQADVFQISSDDTLTTLVNRIRDEGRFVTAALVNDPSGGSSFSLTSRRGGEAGRVSASSVGIDLGLRQTAQGRDAAITVGVGNDTGTVLTSSDGVFENAVEGLTITAKLVTDSPVTITVATDRAPLESAIDRFVNQYNTLVTKIDDLTFYNADSNTTGLLFGRSELVTLESGVSRLLTSRLPGTGSIRSAAEVGLSIDETGKLSFNKTKFREAISVDPNAVENFLTHEDRGLVPKLDDLVERFSGTTGILLSRTTTLTSKIEANGKRITSLNVRLENERNRLLKQFYTMESSIAKLQSNQQYISSIQAITIPSRS